MRMVDIIEKKRDDKKLTRTEIEYFIKGVVDGSIPDYQSSALLMAICLNGMDDEETLQLTQSMASSGEQIDLSAIPGVKVDKHSTGGVGDKTTMVLGPIVAACGAPVAKMSGRGLGHTGGTIDKLESIPGFRTDLLRDEFINAVKTNGLAVVGQTGNLVPADKILYALRDVTGTVRSIPLIAASIMSKKLAAGADAIVLDVKVGSGAFMKTVDEAKKLAKTMVEIGKGAGKKTAAIITDMDKPLGKAIGNALEVKEAIEVLNGKGDKDITEVSLFLAGKMLELAGKGDFETCKVIAKRAIEDKTALNKFKLMINSQKGLGDIVNDVTMLPKAIHTKQYLATDNGYLRSIASDALGIASMLLGAGRATKESSIDAAAGITLIKKPGDKVLKGEPLMALHANDDSLFEVAINELSNAVEISPDKPELPPLILSVVE